MKKIVLLLAICLSTASAFAQDDAAAKLKSEGDAAYHAKDYATTVTKYSQYLELNQYKDTVTVYNAAFAALQASKFVDAAKYFDICIKENYNLKDSYIGEAQAYKASNKDAEYVATLKEGLKAMPGQEALEKMLYAYDINEGQTAQKASKFAAAEKLYADATTLSEKSYQETGYLCLGSLHYMQGATTLNGAAKKGAATTPAYKAEKAKADASFKKAKTYIDKCLAINPQNANAKKIASSLVTLMK